MYLGRPKKGTQPPFPKRPDHQGMAVRVQPHSSSTPIPCMALLRSPGLLPTTPFYPRCLTPQSRRLISAAFQITTGHCFDTNYSINFREGADDNNTCPCSSFRDPLHPRHVYHTTRHILLHCPSYSQQRLAISDPTPPSNISSQVKMEGASFVNFYMLLKHFSAPFPLAQTHLEAPFEVVTPL